MKIGEEIKRERKKRGITRKRLAVKVGCSKIQIYRIEKSKVDPAYSLMVSILEFLDITKGTRRAK